MSGTGLRLYFNRHAVEELQGKDAIQMVVIETNPTMDQSTEFLKTTVEFDGTKFYNFYRRKERLRQMPESQLGREFNNFIHCRHTVGMADQVWSIGTSVDGSVGANITRASRYGRIATRRASILKVTRGFSSRSSHSSRTVRPSTSTRIPL